MDWLQLIKQLLTNVIGFTNPSWPQLVLILSLIFMLVFRNKIANLIDRIIKIGKDGMAFAEAKQIPPETLPINFHGNDKNNQSIPPTIEKNRELIKHNLSRDTHSDHQKIVNLSDELALVYFLLRCERVYANIFGSQIQLLVQLKNVSNIGLSTSAIEHHFNGLLKLHPDFFSGTDVNGYMSFLIQAELVIVNDNFYCITDFGKDFLMSLQKTGHTERRAF